MFFHGIRTIWSSGLGGGSSNITPTFVRYGDDTFILACRESTNHLAFDGILRILRSTDDGRTWSSIGTITAPDPLFPDLRDPYMAITPDNEIRLTAFARDASSDTKSYVWITTDPTDFGTETEITGLDFPKLWHGMYDNTKRYFSPNWDQADQTDLDLVKSTDEKGLSFEKYIDAFSVQEALDEPNEVGLIFLSDSRGIAMIRNSGGSNGELGDIATSQGPPHETWDTVAGNDAFEGMEFVEVSGGKVIVGRRGRPTPSDATDIWMQIDLFDPNDGSLTLIKRFDNVGTFRDTSYPSFWYEKLTDTLYMSYYDGPGNSNSDIKFTRITRPLDRA